MIRKWPWGARGTVGFSSSLLRPLAVLGTSFVLYFSRDSPSVLPCWLATPHAIAGVRGHCVVDNNDCRSLCSTGSGIHGLRTARSFNGLSRLCSPVPGKRSGVGQRFLLRRILRSVISVKSAPIVVQLPSSVIRLLTRLVRGVSKIPARTRDVTGAISIASASEIGARHGHTGDGAPFVLLRGASVM